MAGNAKHVKQFYRAFIDIGKCDTSAIIRGGVDNPEEDRDADTIDELGTGKIDYQIFAAFIELTPTFRLDLLAGKSVYIIAGIDYRLGSQWVRSDTSLWDHLIIFPCKL
jgi:hypothetical protein